MQQHNMAILSQAEVNTSGVCRDLTGIFSEREEGKVQPQLKNWDQLTSGDIILADMNEYVLIDKGGIQSASSIHVSFTTDQSVFRFVYRVDGRKLAACNSDVAMNSSLIRGNLNPEMDRAIPSQAKAMPWACVETIQEPVQFLN